MPHPTANLRRSAATLLLLATTLAPCAAQVPGGFAFVLEDGPVQQTTQNFRFVDLTPGGGVTELREQRVFVPYTGVAVDPDDGQVFFCCNPTSLAGVWRLELEYESQSLATWGRWARTAVSRVAVGRDELVWIEDGGGVFAQDIAGQNSARLVLAGAGFEDVAVAGTDAWALDDLGNLTRIDLVSGTTTPLGNFGGGTCLGAGATSARLLLGNSAGEVLELDSASGTVISTLRPGKGPLVAVGVDEFGLPVFATASELWSSLDLVRPLHVSQSTILDVDVGRDGPASALRWGTPCRGTNATAALEQVVVGRPTLGNGRFATRAVGGGGGAAAGLLVGASRSFSQRLATNLPFDLTPFGFTGCDLLVDPVVTAGTTFDNAGAAEIALPVPALPALQNARLRAQWVTLGVPGVAPAVTSDGVTWILR